jgi:outer membrane protein TolC
MKVRKISFQFIVLLVFCHLLSINISAEGARIGLSIEDVNRLAIDQNLDIKLAKIDAEYAKENIKSAKSVFDILLEAGSSYTDDELASTSAYLGDKSLEAEYNFGISKKLPTGTTIEADLVHSRDYSDSEMVTVNPAHESSLQLTLRQPVGKNFFGLEDRGKVKIATLNYEQINLESLDRIETALANCQMAYWNLVYTYKAMELNNDMLNRAQHLYEIYQDRFDRGIAEEPDLYASEANVGISKITCEVAENRILNASNLLKVYLNVDTQESLKPIDALEAPYADADYIEHLKDAIAKRRDYRAALKNVEAQNVNLVIKKNNLWPEIDLVATYERNGIDREGKKSLENVADEDNSKYYLGVDVSMPLENRSARAQKKQAELLKKKALINLKKLELEIASELDERVRQVNLDAERIRKWEKIVKLQSQKLDSEEEMVKYGRSSSDILVRYQNDLLDAQMSLVGAYLDYRLSRIKLELAKNSILINLEAEDLIKITEQNL